MFDRFRELRPRGSFWRAEPDVDVDPYYLGGPEGPDHGGYAPGVPPPMVPGLQPWETGEPEGQPVGDDWRREEFERAATPVACYGCAGTGESLRPVLATELDGGPDVGPCPRCGGSGWES